MWLPDTRRSRAVVAIAATCAIAAAGVTVALARGGTADPSAGTTPAGTGVNGPGGSGPVSTSATPPVSKPPTTKPPGPSTAAPSKRPTTKTTANTAKSTVQPTATPTRKPPTKPDPVPQQGNPLSQTSGLYVDQESQPAYWVETHAGDSRRTTIKAGIADRPIARWFNGDGADASDAQSYVSAASRVGKLPVLVFYHVPERGCDGGSGAASAAAYRSWIDALAASIGKRPAVVILEPDALPQLDCLSPAAQTTRLSLLSYAVDRLRTSAPNTWTYLDAGHDDWTPAATMAKRLQAAGIAHARGIALNVSNYQSTARNVSYAQAVNAALASAKHFVIDTSRNGKPLNGDDWCNPTGQRIGVTPRVGGASGLDLQLWVKPPGESDGDCGIGTGTNAGDFSPAIAMKLLGH
ncbi:glycoside hydrolase family 6 protein [Kribbella sp. NPDC023855]|uniref:glycoside hydrolase family 6 protein n=1 Tax=Kribbella sp. NPDC023855 TaxID=3154698 RepID=UPI0033DA6C90